MTELSLQSIFSHFIGDYQHTHTLSPPQAKVCHSIRVCGTEALGGHRLRCDQCQDERIYYHSCRNRHCPRCQQQATQTWTERQQAHLLPVPYYHVVFTLPHELNPWVQLHPEVIYAILFQTVWQTLKAFGADKKRLGGDIGMTAVLHTWGQSLNQHVHLHCLVPGGALSHDQQHWQAAKSSYLFPVRALSRRFRGAMVSALRRAYTQGTLHRITRPRQVDDVLDSLMQKYWVVYTKGQVKHSTTLVQYLARYTHKIAISHSRILHVDEDSVHFRWKDYRDQQHKVMQLKGEEFVRRFLLHVLPGGLMRIRHYGFLANRTRRKKLACIRACLAQPPVEIAETNHATTDNIAAAKTWTERPCPTCKQGHLQVIAEIPGKRRPWR